MELGIFILAVLLIGGYIYYRQQADAKKQAETTATQDAANAVDAAAWAANPLNPASPNFDQAQYDAQKAIDDANTANTAIGS